MSNEASPGLMFHSPRVSHCLYPWSGICSSPASTIAAAPMHRTPPWSGWRTASRQPPRQWWNTWPREDILSSLHCSNQYCRDRTHCSEVYSMAQWRPVSFLCCDISATFPGHPELYKPGLGHMTRGDPCSVEGMFRCAFPRRSSCSRYHFWWCAWRERIRHMKYTVIVTMKVSRILRLSPIANMLCHWPDKGSTKKETQSVFQDQKIMRLPGSLRIF